MKNERTPRTLADSEFRVGYPISTRRARILEIIGGAAVILALVIFTAWAITGS